MFNVHTCLAVPTRSTPNTHLIPHIMDLLMDIPLDSVPSELKSACEQILKRAREVRKREPVVAYWCELGGGKVTSNDGGVGISWELDSLTGCFSAANASLTVQRTPEGTKFLMKLLTVLEEVRLIRLLVEFIVYHALD
jgi:vacuolar protein sorting-associated protein VTA1